MKAQALQFRSRDTGHRPQATGQTTGYRMWATSQWGHGPWAMRQRLWATGYGSRAMEHGPRVMGHRPRDMGHAGFKDVGTGHAGFEDMT